MRITVKPNEASSAINDAFAAMFHESSGDIQSKVCLTCNRLVYPNQFQWLKRAVLIKRKHLLQPIVEMPESMVKTYHYCGVGYKSEMLNMVLSPHGCYDRNTESFLVCMICYKELYTNQRRPYFTLANNFAFGEAPEELLCLNEVELALVAQSRISGHIFSFHGGKHQCMTGMHSLYDVNLAYIAGSMDHMEQMGFPVVIACVLSGPFTTFQKKFVVVKCSLTEPK